MIGDLIKIVELIGKAIPALSSPDRRRRRIAQKLSNIHELISTVADRAAFIVAFMEHNVAMPKPVALNLIEEQQADLLELQRLLNDANVHRVLSIHVPEFRHFEFLSHPKIERLTILISCLVPLVEVSERKGGSERLEVGHEDALILPAALEIALERSDELARREVHNFQRVFNGGLVHGKDPGVLSEDEAQRLLMRVHAEERHWHKIKAEERGDMSLFPKLRAYDTPVTIIASPDQIRAARAATAQLLELTTQLREQIRTAFPLADLA